jgi:peptidoglycan/LPS O-acetylase OafA/YrhL
VLSYSLYLWQQLAVALTASFPAALVLAFAVATASYYLIESPFNAMRKRFEH